MSDDCGCCEGVGSAAPEALDNPPGRSSLSYRVGTYGTFFRTMMARLGALQSETGEVGSPPVQQGQAGCLGESHRTFLLGGEPDAATALLDSWACVADVLTFYQERIANEGYLRTAIEQRSVVELGRLTGYEPRPGVAASVHLAFTVQDGFDGQIPARTKAQSTPRPGQTAQVFETSEAIDTRAAWNAMRARRRAYGRYIRREYLVQQLQGRGTKLVPTGRLEIFLAGIDQNVQPGDVIILEQTTTSTTSPPPPEDVYRVTDTWRAGDLEHTTIRLVPFAGTWLRGGEWDVALPTPKLDPFALAPTPATAAMGRSRRTLEDLLGGHRIERKAGDLSPDMIISLVAPGMPELHDQLRALLRTLQPEPAPRTWVMRVRAQVFGHNAPEIVATTTPSPLVAAATSTPPTDRLAEGDEASDIVYLDGEFSALRTGSWLVLRAPPIDDPTGELTTRVFGINEVAVQSRRAYGLSGKTTRVSLLDSSGEPGEWWRPRNDVTNSITPIRLAVVYAQAEALKLVGEPVEDDVAGGVIDLDSSIADLPADRLLLVEGERTDVPGTAGLRATELVRVAGASSSLVNPPRKLRLLRSASKDPSGAPDIVDETVPPDKPEAGAKPFSRITLTAPLEHRYKRSSVVIRGNVAHATHGETHDELLGSGDASVPDQRFTLRQGPRTWISAPTPSGIASTLEMRVSGVLWPEVRASAILGPRDEVVRSRTLGDGRDEIKGGDGRNGARFPTGIENLTARYRVGLGAAGNVEAGLVTALLTRPMGVQGVINPLRASGGADPDGRDEIRARIPIAARGIDRLVSVADYADFALNFAGVDKAVARYEPGASDGALAGLPTVHVVIASDEDVPIDEGSDLLGNLRAALRREGDPTIQAVVRVADAVPMVLQAGVRIDPRYEWPRVEAAMRERLLARFGWAARAIGEAAHLSLVLEALQSVGGVRSVDVDIFGPLRSAARPAKPAKPTELIAWRIADRLAGLVERIQQSGGERRWSFAAGPDEILYFSRSFPDAVVFLEVAL